MIDFERTLNPQQFIGVSNTEGPVLVLAGAGSGKTRLLTHKLAYLIQELGIDPSTIMAVTFTNKAANEMKERVENLLNISMMGLWVGTFHSIAGRILRREANSVGINEGYTIYDTDDSLSVVKSILKDMNIGKEKAKSVLSAISQLKNDMISPQEYSKLAANEKTRFISEVYEKYQDTLLKNNSVDFDDMLLHTVNIFKADTDILDKWAYRFRYLLVDEFQDTNLLQYEFIRLLAGHHLNLTVVGDDDQSIYSWRGAKIENILNFPQDFPNTKIVKLEQNYRSTKNILSAAGAVVEKNSQRHQKKLWTDRVDGDLLEINQYNNDFSEADNIVLKINGLIQKGVNPNEIAVLYRMNYLSRLLETRLLSNKIPYEIVGGQKFYERMEVKDILAYLRLIVNPDDDISFQRVVNRPRRGIGEKSMENLIRYAKGRSLMEVIADSDFDCLVSAKAKKGFSDFNKIITDLREYKDVMTVAQIMEAVIETSGYAQTLIEEGTEEAESRLQNLGELQSSAQQYDDEHKGNASLTGFLETTSLISDIDTWQEDVKKVNLMTVHAAKGLEFGHVFIVAMEDGIFPVIRDDGDNDIEEERRLLYVAITRGKDSVFLSHSNERQRFGNSQLQLPSRFLCEIPEYCTKAKKISKPKFSKTAVQTSKGGSYREKMRVNHPFFGIGLIIKVRGSGDSTVLTVNFKDHGVKKLVASFAKLEIIGG